MRSGPWLRGVAVGGLVFVVACSHEPHERSPRVAAAPVGVTGWVTPERFGARGGDARDDSAALERALVHAATTGGGVRLRATTYVLGSSLDLPSGTVLAGRGAASVLRFTWRRNDTRHDGYYVGNADQRGGDRDIHLSDLRVDGAWTSGPAGPKKSQPAPLVPGIRLRRVDGFSLQRLEVAHVPGISVLYEGCSHGRIIGNRVHDAGRDGITGTWHVEPLHDVVVAGNTISRVGDDAVAVVGAGGEVRPTRTLPYRVTIRDNVVRGWRRDPTGLALGRGVAVLAAERVRVVDNDIAGTASYGILVAGATNGAVDPSTGRPWQSRDVTVRGNTVARVGTGDETRVRVPLGDAGVAVLASRQVRVVGNDVRVAPHRAVAVHGCSGCRTGS